MSTNKNIDKICCIVLAITLIITVLFMNGEKLGLKTIEKTAVYKEKLFDTSKVHTIDIVMDNWEDFLDNCESEEYYACSLVIDNESCKNVAIRAKGNTSLTQVASYGNDRYSFKIEFDHYDNAKTYYGLDKLCLNNIIQDNTYMKDYLTYQMMLSQDVASPLCSYVYITVNGEDWGLYLAVEGVEDAFLDRNYPDEDGELYKPDSMNMGGGRGNGENFDMDKFNENSENTQNNRSDTDLKSQTNNTNQVPSDFSQIPENKNAEIPQMPNGKPDDIPSDFNGKNPFNENTENDENDGKAENFDFKGSFGNEKDFGGKGGGMNSSDDVLLKYIDDNAESYSNIFDNAKTNVTSADKSRLIESLKNLSECKNLEETVDTEKVIKYFAVHNFVLNFDSYTGSMVHNYYLYENDGKLQMIPWDYNLAFGGFQGAGDSTSLVNYPIDTPVSSGNVDDRPMLAWIFSSEEYTELYHKYFSEFIENYFESGYFEEMIDNTISLISPYVEKDPTKFCTYEEFEKGSQTLKEFCLLRSESIRAQLDGTIGSTSDTQKSETLISAANLSVSDMGSMNNSGNDMKKDDTDIPTEQNDNETENNGTVLESETQDNTPPQIPDGENFQNATPPELPNGEKSENGGNTPPQMPNFAQEDDVQENPQGDNQPELPQSENSEQSNVTQAENDTNESVNQKHLENPNTANNMSSAVIMTVISFVVLVIGIIVAYVFKRRKQ